MLERIFAVLLCLGLMSCASRAIQTEQLLADPTGLHGHLPDHVENPNAPFVEQSAGYCGPAALDMAMAAVGTSIPVEDLAKQMYNPQMQGSLQTDLISASRRHGFMAVPIHGLYDLLTELSAGHNVIVFENLAVEWLPQWHYAFVFGYDLPNQEVIMHSGPHANKHWDMTRFERSWMLGDYWGLVILQAGELTETASEAAELAAAVGLEQLSRQDEAEISYSAILKKWPGSLGALIGLGNIAYGRRDFIKSAEFLRAAVKAHPQNNSAIHNLAVVENKLSQVSRH